MDLAPSPALVPLDTCPACGARGGRPAGVKSGGIQILRCLDCGLVHATAHYDRAFLADDFYANRAQGSRSGADAHALARKRRSVDLYDRLSGGRIGHPAPGAKVLDVGCLTGLLLDVLQEKGYETHGIERSREAARIAGEHHQVHSLDVESERDSASLPHDFALVTFTHVLEHLRRPVEALSFAKSLLAPDGRVLVEVPNWDDAARRLWGARYRPLELGDHLSFFDRDSLEMVAKRAGLVPDVLWSAPEGATTLLPSVLTALDTAKALQARARGAGVAATRVNAGAAPGKLKTRLLAAFDRLDPVLGRIAADARWGANLVAILRPA